MLRNYLLVALRQLWKYKLYTILNTIGLVAGIVCFLLITFYITNDLQYDQYHDKKNRIYRLALGGIEQNQAYSSVSGGVMPHVLLEEYTGIEKVVRFRKLPSLVTFGDHAEFEEKFFFTDSTVFDVFSFPLVHGNARTALIEPYSLVVTEETAEKYFGDSNNVLGQLLQVDNSMTFKVTGVLKNIPGNSHFRFDFLASASTLPLHPQEPVRSYQLTGWYAHYFYNYILLEEKADPVVIGKNIIDAPKYHSDPEEYKLYGSNMGLFLQPLTSIHLNPLYGEIEPQGDRIILYILGGVASLILILACVNFGNINASLSLGRRKEVGLRKTLGANRKQVAFQFFGESTLLCLLAVIIGLAILQLVLPWFNAFTGKTMHINLVNEPSALLIILSAIVIPSILGGFYPTFVVGRFSASSILKGHLAVSNKFGFRKVIIVMQFVISMVLIGGSLIITQQVKHMLGKDLGLNSNHVISIPLHGDPEVLSKIPLFFERLDVQPHVLSHAVCELIPGETVFGIIARFEGHENENYSTIGIGYDFLNTFQIDLVAGRDFSPDQPLDTLVDRVIINETLARRFGWSPEEAIGKSYDRGGDGERPGEVIGVTRDFNFSSLRNNVAPLVMSYSPNFFDKAVLRLSSGSDLTTSIAHVKETWSLVFPDRPFDFRFVDDSIQKQYQSENKFGKLFTCFSWLAILIGGLGLFGMVSLDLNVRTKEIGIRKVLGGTIFNLITHLSRSFLKLVFIAFALSIPLTWWLSKQWLSNFAYRLESLEWMIILPGLGVVLLALTIVSLQTTKSAMANPVDSLRTE